MSGWRGNNMKEIFSGLSDRETQILDYIHKNGPLTKSDIIENLDTKLSTLNRAMKTLEDRKLIFESGRSDSSGGRRPAEYDVAHDGIYAIGVDISRTYAKVVVTNLKNQILEKYRFDMNDGMTPQKCADRIADAVGRMISKLTIDRKTIIGVGVGTVGPMNRESGMLLHPQGFPNEEWDADVPIGELLRGKTGLPCAIDNGANTAALLEYYFGSGRGSRCVAYIHCGVGIRSAVIRDGGIIRTMNDAEDAFAKMAIDIDGKCLEDFVSLEAIRDRYHRSTGRQVSYEELFGLASGNDEAASEVFGFSARILSLGISNLAKLLDPDLVILSGPLITNNESYYAGCMKAFRARGISDHSIAFSRQGAFQDDVVAAGAGLMLIERAYNRRGI